MNLQRNLFPLAPEYALLRRVLLVQDGSTTRLCETLSGGPVDVTVHKQVRTSEIPEVAKRYLGGEQWLERITSLSSDGHVLMDNLSFTRLDAVPKQFLEDLNRGIAPIGHLLESLYVQREALEADDEVTQRLWDAVGLPDGNTSRAYRILTSRGPFMYIFECFRGGLVGKKT